jgi:hypothetical protein
LHDFAALATVAESDLKTARRLETLALPRVFRALVRAWSRPENKGTAPPRLAANRRAPEKRTKWTSNPALAQKLIGAMIQDIVRSGGKITAATYQAMAKTGGASWIHATPQFITGAGSVLAGDIGGDRAGTAMQTLYQLLTGATTMSKQQYEVFKAAGLIDPSKVSVDKGGRINAKPGAIKGSLEYSDDLYGWAQFIKGPLEKLAKGNPAVFESLLAKIGRNRNSIKLLTMFTDPGFGDQIAKDIAIWAQAMGVDQGYNAMIGRAAPITSQLQLSGGIGAADAQAAKAARMADYGEVMKALQTQWESLMMAVAAFAAVHWAEICDGLTRFYKAMEAFVEHIEALAAKLYAKIPTLQGIEDGARANGDNVANMMRVNHSLAANGYSGSDLASEMRRESSRGRSLSVTPNVDVKTYVSVTLDGAAIAAGVTTRIVKSSRGDQGLPNDTGLDWTAPGGNGM